MKQYSRDYKYLVVSLKWSTNWNRCHLTHTHTHIYIYIYNILLSVRQPKIEIWDSRPALILVLHLKLSSRMTQFLAIDCYSTIERRVHTVSPLWPSTHNTLMIYKHFFRSNVEISLQNIFAKWITCQIHKAFTSFVMGHFSRPSHLCVWKFICETTYLIVVCLPIFWYIYS